MVLSHIYSLPTDFIIQDSNGLTSNSAAIFIQTMWLVCDYYVITMWFWALSYNAPDIGLVLADGSASFFPSSRGRRICRQYRHFTHCRFSMRPFGVLHEKHAEFQTIVRVWLVLEEGPKDYYETDYDYLSTQLKKAKQHLDQILDMWQQ